MARGNFYGSGIVGAIDYFVKRHGPAAANAVVAKLPPEYRHFVQPNAPCLGLLGARLYPYPFIGELVRTMVAVVRAPDEDAFIREVVAAGMDATLTTAVDPATHHVFFPLVAGPAGTPVLRIMKPSGT